MDRKQRRRRDLPKEMKEYRRNFPLYITQTHTLKHKHIIEKRSDNRVANSPQDTHTNTQRERERERGITLCRFQVEEKEEEKKKKRKENQKIIEKSKNLLTSWEFRLAPPLMRREAHVNFPFPAAR